MRLSIQKKDLFAPADALFLTIDGVAPGMEGRLFRMFDKKHPDADIVEEVDSQLVHPTPLGRSVLLELEEGTSPYKAVVLLSVLDHGTSMTTFQRRVVVRGALEHALRIASAHGFAEVRCPLLRGGWRLSDVDAFQAMLDAFDAAQRAGVARDLHLTLCSLDDVERLQAHARSQGW